ncbi:DnaJ domain-containing protein [Myxococcota bacterium]|nr:DnaJ domain-containing protein [Myxococcota bacterium]
MPVFDAAVPTPVDQVLARLVAGGATGALEVKSDEKRWLFFFSGGALVFTRSNLKSEQTESIRQKVGDLPNNELIRLQAERRIRNVCRLAAAEVSFHEGAHPPQVTPVNAIAALCEGLRQAYEADALAARLAPVLAGFPRIDCDLGGLGFPPAIEHYLQDLDGGRTGADVVAFAPGSPDQVQAALLGLWLLGDLVVDAEPSSMPVVTAVSAPVSSPVATSPAGAQAAAPPPASPASPDPGLADALDLGALLADAVSAGGAAPPPQVQPAPVPPPPAASASPATSASPAAPPSTEHPLARRLHELARRMRASTNHFELLGVHWEGTPDEFRRAYTDLARELHPDRYHEAPQELRDLATDLFDQIRLAWEVLGNDAARGEYIDVVVHGKKTAEQEAMEALKTYWAADDSFKKALTNFNNGRIREAHEQFRQAALAVPDELIFQAYYGYTSFALAYKTDPAAADRGVALLRDVIERNKSQERQLDMAWALLGRACREKGEPESARRALVQALRINPANDAAVRELRRLEDQKASKASKGGGFLAGLFGRK